MFAQNFGAPVALQPDPPLEPEVMHLMLVRTPRLNPRGLAWLKRSQQAEFDGVLLQRLIRMEKLGLG